VFLAIIEVLAFQFAHKLVVQALEREGAEFAEPTNAQYSN
jgi:hypothetical protein